MIPNYYKFLGVTPDASKSEIKRAYRRLARLHHPDASEQSEDAQMKRINEAYTVLSDAQKRVAYDVLLRQDLARAEAARRERERLQREQEERERAQREPKMTWVEGMFGFVRELKKGMRDD
jgi:DnaJ-class molecular chaperone